MTIPDNADSKQNEDKNVDTIVEDTFENKVNNIIKQSIDTDGNLNFPEGTPEHLIYAVNAELRRRETQSSYTTAKQNEAVLRAENSALKNMVENDNVWLSDSQRMELAEIKLSDPDKYLEKKEAFIKEAKAKRKEAVETNLKEVSAKEKEKTELENRKTILKEFMSVNSDIVINDDVIENDIPPRITNKLKNNEITFEKFLHECKDYLTKNKVVYKGSEVSHQPNLSKAGGGHSPVDNTSTYSIYENYENTTY